MREQDRGLRRAEGSPLGQSLAGQLAGREERMGRGASHDPLKERVGLLDQELVPGHSHLDDLRVGQPACSLA